MDKQKVDQIITEYLPKIYGYSVKKSFSYDEAEDLCADIIQEVYVSLLRAGEIGNPDGYIWRISQRTYAKRVSSQKKQQNISLDDVIIPFYEKYLPEDSEIERMRLRREIAFLTETRRRIVYLFIGATTAVMVMDILYESGVFRPLTEREKVTSQLFMFSDILPGNR